MNLEKAHACPFCKYKDLIFIENAKSYEVRVSCLTCGVDGPISKWVNPDHAKITETLQGQAIEFWNGTAKWEKPKK